MKGAQTGVTEAAINRALYTLDKLKRDVLYVLPTSTAASDFSKARFGGALEHSPYLKSIFTETNAVNIKRAGANTLYIRGSRGKASLISIPVSELILDELDAMEQQQLWLALERLSGQVHKHVWGISTPTIPDYGIHKVYTGSTQEHFFFKCPSCGRRTELVWPDCIVICGEHTADPRCAESYLKCKECGATLHQQDKPRFLAEGKWESTDANGNKEIRGFQISQLYSFTVSPGELVVAHFRGFGDEFAAKEFHNSKLGLPYIGAGAKVTDGMLDEAIRPYTTEERRPRYASEKLITMGGDQGKWNPCVVCEWLPTGRGSSKDLAEAYDCKVLWYGKFADGEVWERFAELMCEWQVLYAVVDADPELNLARGFCRRFEGHAATCRYREGREGKEVSKTAEDTGAPMLTVDRTYWLDAALGRFKTRRIILPRDVNDEFRSNIKSLTRTYVREKTKDKEQPVKAVYVNTGADHYAHCLAYAEIALQFAPLSVTRPMGQVL
jgi:hypothetical protein